MNVEQLDAQRDSNIIIPRALFMTNAASFDHDIEKLENFYSSSEIVKTLQSTKERISNKICELVAQRYHVPVFHRYPH